MASRISFTVLLLALLAAFPCFAGSCGQAPVRVNITADIRPLTTDFSFSYQTLTEFGKHDMSRDTIVGGLTRSGIGINGNYILGWIFIENDQQNCFYFKDLSIQFKLIPKIYVASEFKAGTCLHNEVFAHEMKHYKVDYNVIQEYKAIYQAELSRFAASINELGPFLTSRRADVTGEISKRTEKIFHALQLRMVNDLEQRQGQIDTPQEYARVPAACPHEAPWHPGHTGY